MPDPLLDQLAIDGVLIVPVGSRFSQQILKIKRTKQGTTEEYHTPCVFVPLIGEHGWKDA
jgi:protein-L-isoaspartate(D-aspartate) O-methyltransferase